MLALDNVCKRFGPEERGVTALAGLSLEVPKGQFLSITGASGSGKSTLLHLVAGLDTATQGDVIVGGTPLSALTDDELTVFRRRHVGVVFQFFHLLPDLDIEANVALPLLLDGRRPRDVAGEVTALLEGVGLGHRLGRRPTELSGGEMQRVAIARALIIEPILLVADEPTGNLDTRTGEQILDLLTRLVKDRGHTAIMVTHDPRATRWTDREVRLQDGRIVADTTPNREDA